MPHRIEQLKIWLSSLPGMEGFGFEPASGDASFRRYFRVSLTDRSYIAMDAPPDKEDTAPFIHIAEAFEAIGLHVPHIHARDLEQGFLLLEDFGNTTFTRALAEGADEAELYRLATDALVALHQGWWVESPKIQSYDEEKLLTEAALLVDWYLPVMTGRETPAAQRESYLAAWREVVPVMLAVPHKLVLRDYHDLSYREIAAVLSIPEGTVMSRLHRGRKALQKKLWNLAEERGLTGRGS